MGKIKHIVILAFTFIFIIGQSVAFTPIAVHATSGVGAHSATNADGDVFLGGNYIEVGVSELGSFGTSGNAPTGFHTTDQLGLIVDGDGWEAGNDPTTGDFFLPGTPEERFILAYKLLGDPINNNAGARVDADWENPQVALSTEDDSDLTNGILRAITTGTTAEGVSFTQVIEFGVNDLYYTTIVTIENNGANDLTDFRYVRSFDPDMDEDLNNTYSTFAKVIVNPKADTETPLAITIAKGAVTLDSFYFLASDNRARATAYVAFDPDDAYMDGLWVEDDPAPEIYDENNTLLSLTDIAGVDPETDEGIEINGYILEDNGIAITFSLGDLNVGEGTSFFFVSSLDPNVSNSLDTVLAKTSEKFTVNFYNWDDSLLKTQEVAYGKAAIPPTTPTKAGFKFFGWSDKFNFVTGDLDVTAGFLKSTVTVEGSGVTVDISNLEALGLQSLIDGETTVEIELTVDVIESSSVTEEEKGLFIGFLSDESYDAGTKLYYMNVELFKIVDESTTAITSTTGLVKISIVLPEALRTGTKFKMLRLHDGEVEEIATSYNEETFVLTFYTNRFSVYSISYVEGLPNTGNVANYNFLILSMGLALVLISRRRKFDYQA